MPITNTTCPNGFSDLPTALSASSAQARPANAQWYYILPQNDFFHQKICPPHTHHTFLWICLTQKWKNSDSNSATVQDSCKYWIHSTICILIEFKTCFLASKPYCENVHYRVLRMHHCILKIP